MELPTSRPNERLLVRIYASARDASKVQRHLHREFNGKRSSLAIAGMLLHLQGSDLIFIPKNPLEHGIVLPDFQGVLTDKGIWLAVATIVLTLTMIDFLSNGMWNPIYAVTMGLAVYLNFFVLVTQLFLKVPALHALAPNAPDNPEPPFLIAQSVVLLIFIVFAVVALRSFHPQPNTSALRAV